MGAVFLLSDVHGFRDDLVRGLQRARLLDDDERWSGGDAELWVLGDLLDRGPDGIGVVELLHGLQQQAPDQVHVLLGNHEALAIGAHRFPGSRFASSWAMNGGRISDQAGLAPYLDWLSGLPAVGRVGDALLLHSDTTAYLDWGSTAAEVNAAVADRLAGDLDSTWEVWSRLTTRYSFVGEEGAGQAGAVLSALGGNLVVHGHSIIGSLLDIPSAEVTRPVLYADGWVLAIDGGRYDGGPLLVVRME